MSLNLSTKRACCMHLLVFLKSKESLTITPFWHWRVFAKVAATKSSTKVLNKWFSSLVHNIYMLQREVLFLRIGNLLLYVRSTLHEKMEFFKHFKFGLRASAFNYGSCLNASLSPYSLLIFLYLRIHWKLSTILKTRNTSVWSNVFLIWKVYIF